MASARPQISAVRLRELLQLDLNTGDFKWRSNGKVAGCLDKDGYVVIHHAKRQYRAHRLVWLYIFGQWPTGPIDHINRDRSDNRIENLRECTLQQNRFNTGSLPNSSSKYKGVSWHKRDRKWQAVLTHNDVNKYLGAYNNEEDAAKAYDAEARRVHKQYAKLNFPTWDQLDCKL